MKENNKSSMILLTVIGIATLLIAVIGATFAFFTVQIQGNVEEATVEVTSSTMVVQFDKKNEINYINAFPGRPNETYENNKLRFTLTSDKGLSSTTEYNVYLVIDKNEFLKNPNNTNATDELVYFTTPPTLSNNTRTISSVADSNETAGSDGEAWYENTINNVKYNPETLTIIKKDEVTNEEKSEIVTVGLIPSEISYDENITEENKVRILVGKGILGSHESQDEWQVEIWLKETREDQYYNQGKNLIAHVDIEVTNSYVSHEEK